MKIVGTHAIQTYSAQEVEDRLDDYKERKKERENLVGFWEIG